MRLDEPNACRWCGIPERGHYQRWCSVPEIGWHQWTEPTDEQRKARMLARRFPTARIVDGYWVIDCGDCAGTGLFIGHPENDNDPCTACKQTGNTIVCLARQDGPPT